MSETQQPTQLPAETVNNMAAVRQHMLDQLQALRTAPAGEKLDEELKRSKGVSSLSQTIIDSARVEVEYISATQGVGGGTGTVPFLDKPAAHPPMLGGPGAQVAWNGGGTVHKMQG